MVSKKNQSQNATPARQGSPCAKGNTNLPLYHDQICITGIPLSNRPGRNGQNVILTLFVPSGLPKLILIDDGSEFKGVLIDNV
jgi:hypothetical protein